MTQKSILILSSSHLCRNPRVLKEATTLAENGFDTKVLSVKSHPPSVTLDAELVASAKFSYHQVDLLNGLGAKWSRLRSRLARTMCAQFGLEQSAALGATSALLRESRHHPAELTIAHVEPALWAAERLLKEGRRVAADIEDWHSEDLPHAERRHRPTRLLRRIERELMRNAAYVSTTSDAMAKAMADAYDAPVPRVIYNAFPLQPPPHTDIHLHPSIVWFSQTTGPDRGLEPFLAAWSRTRSPSRVTLLGAVSSAYRDTLSKLVGPAKRTMLEFQDPVPPESLPEWLAQHDLGLALEKDNIRNRYLTVTNKILQYLNAGLGVLATPTAGQQEIMKSSPDIGTWFNPTSSAEESSRILDKLLADSARIRAMKRAARQAAESQYCWERQAPILLRLVESSLNLKTT